MVESPVEKEMAHIVIYKQSKAHDDLPQSPGTNLSMNLPVTGPILRTNVIHQAYCSCRLIIIFSLKQRSDRI
jgi:hypothetical protein